jgi:hypothetical protein
MLANVPYSFSEGESGGLVNVAGLYQAPYLFVLDRNPTSFFLQTKED